MKIWKIVRVVTVVILLAFIVFVIQAMIRNYNYQGSYPYPAIGMDVHNWVEGTMIDVGIFFMFFIIPLTTAVILFIISCVKISRLSRCFFLSRLGADGMTINEKRFLGLYSDEVKERTGVIANADEIARHMAAANVITSFSFWHEFLHGNEESMVRGIYDKMVLDYDFLRRWSD